MSCPPSRRAGAIAIVLLPVLLLALLAGFAAAAVLELPASVIMESKLDAQQVLLLRVSDNGTSTDVLLSQCGADTYYSTSALVLGVNRTVDPDETAIGAANEGRVMSTCDELTFKTHEREWREGECSDYADPGRRREGWCGYVYLLPGAGEGDPYVLAAGARSFEEVDGSVCAGVAVNECGMAPVEFGEDWVKAAGDRGGGGDEEAAKSGARAAFSRLFVVAIAAISAIASPGAL